MNINVGSVSSGTLSNLIPDDLMDFEDFIPEKNTKEEETKEEENEDGRFKATIDTSHNKQIKMGDSQDRPSKKKFFLVLFILFFFLAIIVVLIGFFQHHDLRSIFDRTPQLSIEFVEACNDSILMIERSGNINRVIVEKLDYASWFLVSKDDTTVTNPALSPEGDLVAYLTQRNNGEIVIISPSTSIDYTVTFDQIKQLGQKEKLQDMKICPWTPIAWDSKNSRVSFFGCFDDQNITHSVVIVCKFKEPTPVLAIIPDSIHQTAIIREIKWMGINQLSVNTPMENYSKIPLVKRFDVPFDTQILSP
jgi:hypothetical protein